MDKQALSFSKPEQNADVAAAEAPAGRAGFCVVALGASAGGLEALCQFFEAMPAKCGMAFVVIQHLSPQHVDFSPEILGRHSTMPVLPAENGAPLAADHVYIIPAGFVASLEGLRFKLLPQGTKHGPPHVIDTFFSALALALHEQAIGIVLSGTGSDGTLGVRDIVSEGGIVLAQAPPTTRYDSMPASAIATGLVHHILPAAEMPAVLQRYVRHPYVADPGGSGSMPPKARVAEVLAALRDEVGCSFNGYKSATVTRRIERRMGLKGITHWLDYRDLLRHDRPEAEALRRDLLIGFTEFFRDPVAWKLLREKAIRPLVARHKAGDTLRAWVPGCSTGEEAYSLAMLILEEMQAQERPCAVQVFATDANDHALQLGRQGLYPPGVAHRIPEPLLNTYFTLAEDGTHYQVSKMLRNAVVFGQHDLLNEPPFCRQDLVCCRNLLIYLEPEMQDRAMSIFQFALAPEGFLFLGATETARKPEPGFTTLSRKWRIFHYQGTHRQIGLDLSLCNFRLPQGKPAVEAGRTESLSQAEMQAFCQKALSETLALAAIIVTASGEAIHFHGKTEHYLRRPEGPPTRDLLAIVRNSLRSHLRGALHQADKEQRRVDISTRLRRGEHHHGVQISVLPAGMDSTGQPLLAVLFAESPQPLPDLGLHDGPSDVMLGQLEEELRVTRADLQATIERLECSNDDLKGANEAVISANEELQSTNEELESTREEMHSLNEELTALNQQLQSRVEQLEVANADQRNLLASIDIATACLDEDLRIKWFTPCLRKLCNVLDTDLGRPISDFSSRHLGPFLVQEAQATLADVTCRQRELRLGNERWYLRRLLPYRSSEGKVIGVIVTYTDISENRESSERMAAAQRRISESLEERVAARTAQLRALWYELSMAEERERRSLTQDLHDDLGQVLAIAKLKLNSLDQNERRGKLKEALCEIEELVDHANTSVRSLMMQMSPPLLNTQGLLPALEWLGEEMERIYGLTVHIYDDGEPKPLDEASRNALFRMVRELLINVAKHARVDHAEINCLRDHERMTLAVTDHGNGFDYQPVESGETRECGFGLHSIRERLHFLGGEMNVDSTPGDGATITLSAPLQAPPPPKERRDEHSPDAGR